MARADRLLRLLQVMRQMPAPITALRLAEATEVSLRSLYRDIDGLRAAGARIEGERGYGYRLVEDFALPPLSFTREELEVIALGMAEVSSMGNAEMATTAASVLAKVSATLPSDREQELLHAISRVYRPNRRIEHSPFFAIVQDGCWHERALDIAYVDEHGALSQRIILPLSLVYTDHILMVLSWCCLREDFRMFRLDRLQGVAPAGRSFRPRRVALLREYIARLAAEDTATSAGNATLPS